WHAATAVTITNNLVFECSGVGIIVTGDDYLGDDYLVANNIVIHNRIGIREYGRVGTNNRFLNNLMYANDRDYLLTEGSATGSITANPGLIDFQLDGNGDYRLASGSPAIDAGVPDGAPPADIDGMPRVGVIDVGPYEYSGTSPFAASNDTHAAR
ncbi:MAG: hypothetical protein LC667_08650, partial [Thioalkalivibrio sp.]|nr:hypothetical protein [Thioalkalivibrio sp.]